MRNIIRGKEENSFRENCFRFFIFVSLLCIFSFTEVNGRDTQLIRWDFNKDSEGWTPTHSFSQFIVKDGVLYTEVTGFDPYMHSPILNLDAKTHYLLEIRTAVDKGSEMSIYWITDESPNWGEDKKINFKIIPDNEFHTYSVDIGIHKKWLGKITQFRLDLEPPDTNGAHIRIDYVQLGISSSKVEVYSMNIGTGVPRSGKSFPIYVTIKNPSGEVFKDVSLKVKVLDKVFSESVREIQPRDTKSFSFNVKFNKEGIYKIPIEVTSGSKVIDKGDINVLVTRDNLFEQSPGDITLENSKIFIRFVRVPSGFTTALLYGKKDNKLELLSVIHPLSSITYTDPEGDRVTDILCPSIARKEGNKVVFEGENNLYKYKITIEKTKDDEIINTDYELSAKGDIKLVRFDGPFLRVGEGSFGVKKVSALFPGLEWLVGEERSSSTLDAMEPFNMRLVPNPNKITVPCMGIESNNYLIGLLWKGEDNQPASIFCSPNWYENQENHLLGLFLPYVPDYVKENETYADIPYVLRAGDKISIGSKILISYNRTILDLVPKWLSLYDALDVKFPRSFEEEIRLCEEGYKGIWEPNAPGWPHATPGNWTPSPYPKDAFLLYIGSIFTKDKEAKRMADTVINFLIKEPYRLSDPGGSHIYEFQLPFIIGRLPQSVGAFKDFVSAYLASQKPDGSFVYSSSMSMQEKRLGEEGETNVGLCAVPASVILRYARVTGDDTFLRGGLTALEFMKRFRVPRGAQVWEVPVHTPDILASARAVDAYLEGYIITGNSEYLDRAVYWAKTGLPFVYLWSRSDRPVMKYSTIPVFGATFFDYPWFGYPVQWNGLVYAYELLRLARYDNSFLWKDIATGILASGMYQQMTGGEYKGLYPDSWDLDNNLPRGPYINPEDLLKPLYLLMGIPLDLDTKVINFRGNNVYITTIARIKDINVTDKCIKITIDNSSIKEKYLLITKVDRPKSILLDDREIKELSELEFQPIGYRYYKDYKWLVVKVHEGSLTRLAVNF